jgi:hypothetical protein
MPDALLLRHLAVMLAISPPVCALAVLLARIGRLRAGSV